MECDEILKLRQEVKELRGVVSGYNKKEYHKQYQTKNKKEIKEWQHQYYIVNIEDILENKREYYRINAEKIKAKRLLAPNNYKKWKLTQLT